MPRLQPSTGPLSHGERDRVRGVRCPREAAALVLPSVGLRSSPQPCPHERGGGDGRVIRAVLAMLVLVCAYITPALAQTDLPFPPLTGRVVDNAGLLRPEERNALEAKLKAHEDKTSDQVVVATVTSLGGTSVEDYANRLFRAWKLGVAKTNNGVLFLVAPTERKTRIEVGYGLEGSLTDAIASVIITSAVAPRFKAGDWASGINAGVDAIIGTLTGDTEEWQRRARLRPDTQSGIDPVLAFAIFLVVLVVVMRLMRGGGGGGTRYHRRGGGLWMPMSIPSSGGFGGSFGGGSSGGFSGGGFSGGGGSSGGGGASGSW
jgi:uncharacterized protein